MSEIKSALLSVASWLTRRGYVVPVDVMESIKELPDDDIDPDEAYRVIELYMADYRSGRITLTQLINKVKRATGATITGEEKPQDIERLKGHVMEAAAAAYQMALIVQYLDNLGYTMNQGVTERIYSEAEPYKPKPLTEPTSGSQSQYQGVIERIASDLYGENITYSEAERDFMTEIEKQFTAAWQDGMMDVGVNAEEMTQAEKQELDSAIIKERGFVTGFLSDIEQARLNGKPLDPFISRAALWANRYAQIRTQAKIEAAKNQPLEWILGETEKHCPSCAKLAGIVKRAQFWRDAGVEPKNAPNSKLDCGGWRCDCRLDPTEKPITRGPLPALP
mgnify:FL=1